MVCRAENPGFHFIEYNPAPKPGGLPGCLAAGQSTADDYQCLGARVHELCKGLSKIFKISNGRMPSWK
jgi:hypothetical protein